jgi:hypothetical protein
MRAYGRFARPREREIVEGVEQSKPEAEKAGATPLRDRLMPSWWESATLGQGSQCQPAQRDGQRQQQTRQALRRADTDTLQMET